jgi:hypothetical protein
VAQPCLKFSQIRVIIIERAYSSETRGPAQPRLSFSQICVIIIDRDQIAISAYLQRRVAHEADGSIVRDGNVTEPPVTGESGPWPAARQ